MATAAVPAALTRGLHLDGLADTADGLGSGKPAEDALRIMKQSDIGPFGVITLLFVLLAQVAALDRAVRGELGARRGRGRRLRDRRPPRPHPRLPHGVPAARPEGLGAIVAATVPVRSATLSTAAVLVLLAATGLLFSPYDAVHNVLAAGAALGAAAALLRRAQDKPATPQTLPTAGSSEGISLATSGLTLAPALEPHRLQAGDVAARFGLGEHVEGEMDQEVSVIGHGEVRTATTSDKRR